MTLPEPDVFCVDCDQPATHRRATDTPDIVELVCNRHMRSGRNDVTHCPRQHFGRWHEPLTIDVRSLEPAVIPPLEVDTTRLNPQERQAKFASSTIGIVGRTDLDLPIADTHIDVPRWCGWL